MGSEMCIRDRYMCIPKQRTIWTCFAFFFVFAEYQTVLFRFRPRVVSRTLGCGARRRPVCTPRSKCGSRSGFVTGAVGVQSHEVGQVIPGIIVEPATCNQAHVNPHFCYFSITFSTASAAFFRVPQQPPKSKQPRYNSRASSFPLCGSH